MEYVEYSSNMCYPANKDIPFFGLTANPDNYRNILGPRLYKNVKEPQKNQPNGIWDLAATYTLCWWICNIDIKTTKV